MTVTCGALAEMIEAVTEPPFGDDNNSNESALIEISNSDLTVIEWLCRLVPSSTVDALKANDQSPLWGDGAPVPADIATAVRPADRLSDEPNLWRDLYLDLSKSMARVRATLGCASDEDIEDAANRVVAELIELRSRQ